MNHKRPPIPAILLIVLLIAVSAYFLVTQTLGEKNGQLTASGTIEATIINVSPEMAGKVIEVRAEEGQAVKKGDPLLALDDSLLVAQRQDSQPDEHEQQRLHERHNPRRRNHRFPTHPARPFSPITSSTDHQSPNRYRDEIRIALRGPQETGLAHDCGFHSGISLITVGYPALERSARPRACRGSGRRRWQ